jgi:O-antigen ligase
MTTSYAYLKSSLQTDSRPRAALYSPDTRTRLSRRQWLFMGFLILVMMAAGGQDFTFSTHYSDIMNMSSGQLAYKVESGSIMRQIALFSLLVCGVFVLTTARVKSAHSNALRNNVPLACFVGLAFLSVLWSADPTLTFRRSSEYLIFCIGASAAGRALGLRGIVWLGFVGSTVYILLGVAAEVVLGTFHPWNMDYRFCGTLHPNHQAWNCVLLLLSSSVLLSQVRRGLPHAACAIAMILGAVFLFLTKSRTSLLCGVLALIYYWSARLSVKQKLAAVLGGSLAASALLVTTLFSPVITSQLNRALLAGRDANTYQSLSGRIPLWQACMEYVALRPRTGYGFDSFWTPEHIRIISAKEGWTIPMSHNGYIELLLSLGIIGLVLYLFQLASSWPLLQRSYISTRDPMVRFYLALLLYYSTCMFAEAIGFDLGLPTFCLLSMLWARKLWFRRDLSLERGTVADVHTSELEHAYE